MDNKGTKIALAPPAEPARHRSLAEIQQEYTNLCAKAGQVQYQVAVLQKDLVAMNDSLRNLNIEAAQAKQAEAAAVTDQEAPSNG